LRERERERDRIQQDLLDMASKAREELGARAS
jgi:hypothetical protein